MASLLSTGETHQGILCAALKRFAHAGYAATSVQQMVAHAKVSKPTLSCWFRDKVGLFQSLVNEARDEWPRLMREAAGRATSSRAELAEVLSVPQQFGPQSQGQARRPSC